jgi:hypothetical protein
MIWNKKIIDLFLYYDFSFQRFPPSLEMPHFTKTLPELETIYDK